MTNQSLAKYRIRGISEFAHTPAKADSITHEQAEPTSLMGRVLRAFKRPHFSDLVHHPRVLNRLAALCPTFSYFRPKQTCTTLKRTPLHLSEFMDWSTKDSVCLEIIREAEHQKAEEKAIEALIWDHQKHEAPTLYDSPLAMALASLLFRGAAWLTQNKDTILRKIGESSPASFVALQSGTFQEDATTLLNKIAEDPNLLLETWQNQVTRRWAEPEWFTAALTPHPVHHALMLFLDGKSKDALELLYRSAESHAVAAGVALGLDPQHEKHRQWIEAARGCAEAFYWMAMGWKEGGQDIASHPYSLIAYADLHQDPCWYYHWLRVASGVDAIEGVRALWPSAWAVELLCDRAMSPGLVIDLSQDKPLDPQDSLESAILLWASNYSLPKT